jgi:uncharacterized protein (TIGR03437 family)
MQVAILVAVLALADSGAPAYTAAGIANTAASVTGLYAPNTLVTIYGENLANVTRAISAADMSGGMLPTSLIGTGVKVFVNQIAADIYYVSPGQVNLLIPTILLAGPATLQLEANGHAGPAVVITLGETAPGFFQFDATTVLATHGDYSLVTADAPARAGEEIAIYATGLGPTIPAAIPNQVPQGAALLASMSNFRVMLNGVGVDPANVIYAGAVPGYAGLFQINLIVPAGTPSNPEIRAGSGDGLSKVLSPPGRFLAVK